MKALIKIVLAAALLGGAGGGYAVWKNQTERRSIAIESVPAHPDLQAFPVELDQRVGDCEQRSRSGKVEALGELSRLYHSNGYYPEACQCYLGLLRLDPLNPVWPHRLASILAGYGQLEDSLPLWRKAVELAPDYVPARVRLGDALLKTDKREEAAKVYAEALSLAPTNAYALLGIARLDIEAGRWQNARINLEAAARQTNFTVGYDLLAVAYEKLGNHERATALRGTTKASGAYYDIPDPRVDEIYFDCYEPYYLDIAAGSAGRSGNMNAAMQLAERALQISPKNIAVLFKMGGYASTAGNLRAAVEYYRRCTEADPSFSDGWWYYSDILKRMGDAMGAEKVMRDGLQRCPSSPGLRLEHGRRLMEANFLAEAESELRESIRLRPDEAAAYLEMFKLYCIKDQPEKGYEFLKQALLAEPANPILLMSMAFYNITMGDEGQARYWYARMRQQPRIAQPDMQRIEDSFQQRFGKRL